MNECYTEIMNDKSGSLAWTDAWITKKFIKLKPNTKFRILQPQQSLANYGYAYRASQLLRGNFKMHPAALPARFVSAMWAFRTQHVHISKEDVEILVELFFFPETHHPQWIRTLAQYRKTTDEILMILTRALDQYKFYDEQKHPWDWPQKIAHAIVKNPNASWPTIATCLSKLKPHNIPKRIKDVLAKRGYSPEEAIENSVILAGLK